jgi:hypothetical protein
MSDRPKTQRFSVPAPQLTFARHYTLVGGGLFRSDCRQAFVQR